MTNASPLKNLSVNEFFRLAYLLFNTNVKILWWSKSIRRKNASSSGNVIRVRSGKKTSRRYSRRFYLTFLENPLTAESLGKLVSVTSGLTWTTVFKSKTNKKAFFHIKMIFSLNEFLLYDYYNYHRSQLRVGLKTNVTGKSQIPEKAWKKINFFYYIRRSIDTFRSNTIIFFKKKYATDRRMTVFFKGFSGMPTTAYIWFFEYSVAYFLIRVRFSESLGQSILMMQKKLIAVNFECASSRWSVVNPGDAVSSVFSTYLLLRTAAFMKGLLDYHRKTKKFIMRSFLRSKRRRLKMPGVASKGPLLGASKPLHSRLLETDYKTLTVVLLPHNKPDAYLSSITLMWLNFWNYRLNIWKYDI